MSDYVTGIVIGAGMMCLPALAVMAYAVRRPVSPVRLPAEFGRELPRLSPELLADISRVLMESVQILGPQSWGDVVWDNRTVATLVEHINDLHNAGYVSLKADSLNSDQYILACRLGDYLYRCGVPASQSLRVSQTILSVIDDTCGKNIQHGIEQFDALASATRVR